MGGIKNKLSKLIYEPPFRKRRRMKSDRISIGGFDGVSKFTKYTSMACLTLAILSTLVLNIVSSYSSSKVNSNAEPVGNPSVLANDSTCDPNNTNAPSCISMSISSHPATGDTNDGNLSLSIPQGGGLVAGRHTVSVKSNSINGYQLRVEAASGIEEDGGAVRPINLELVHNDGSVDKEHTIPSLTQNNDKNVNYGNTMPIENNTWGIAIPGSSLYGSSYDDVSVYESYIANPRSIDSANAAPKFAGMYKYEDYILPRLIIIDNSYTLDETSTATPADGNSLAVYYGVRVDNPNELLAGNYQAEVVYTATVNLPPTPTNLSVSPTTYEFDSCNDSLITIKGNNLSSAYEVYLQKSGTSGTADKLQCTNLNYESGSLTCNIPTSSDEVGEGVYDIYVISQAVSPGILKNAFTYTEPATGLSVKSDNENIIVDYDENLIPVVYVGYDGNGGGHWSVVTDAEIEQNTSNWFRYDTTEKKWANAITVTAEAREAYRKKQTGEDPDPTITPSDNPTGNGEANPEILGYWVYIPRYAYEVMRPNAVDRVVSEQNFDIRFETINDTKKIPAESCNLGISTADQMWANGTPTGSAGPTNTNILAKDYRTGCGIDRTYPGNDATKSNGQTTWATHPAFSWGTEETGYTELNGIWVGKFETTGKVSAPTVKPNQHANIGEFIGNFYLAAKSIGQKDRCNIGGGANSSSFMAAQRPDIENSLVQNSHNLRTTKSHMLKNSEWGAVAYLSASNYGSGVNGAQVNQAISTQSTDADGQQLDNGITGCGPSSINGSEEDSSYRNEGTTLDSTTIESSTACSQDITKTYTGRVGVLSSTTRTVYGVYDMSGGANEYVAGNLTSYNNQTQQSTYMQEQAVQPYVDLYKETPYGVFNNRPLWSYGTDAFMFNNDVCTWNTCGGHALHETKKYQSVEYANVSWGDDWSQFVWYGSRYSHRWFLRGLSASSWHNAGLFGVDRDTNGSISGSSYRITLLALPKK